MSGERLTGCLIAEAVVRPSDIIAFEVIEQPRVEQARGFGREVFFLIHEVFLHGAVETFVESVHLRTSRVGVARQPCVLA